MAASQVSHNPEAKQRLVCQEILGRGRGISSDDQFNQERRSG